MQPQRMRGRSLSLSLSLSLSVSRSLSIDDHHISIVTLCEKLKCIPGNINIKFVEYPASRQVALSRSRSLAFSLSLSLWSPQEAWTNASLTPAALAIPTKGHVCSACMVCRSARTE